MSYANWKLKYNINKYNNLIVWLIYPFDRKCPATHVVNQTKHGITNVNHAQIQNIIKASNLLYPILLIQMNFNPSIDK